jgi:hypothetical protein
VARLPDVPVDGAQTVTPAEEIVKQIEAATDLVVMGIAGTGAGDLEHSVRSAACTSHPLRCSSYILKLMTVEGAVP